MAITVFISMEPLSQVQITQPAVLSNQLVDDAVAAMDNTGFIMQSIESGNPSAIETKLRGLLPGSIDFRLEMMQYTSNLDDPLSECRSSQAFQDCFPNPYPPGEENPQLFFEVGSQLPDDRSIFHGRKLFIKKEPGECEIAEGLKGKESEWFELTLQANQAPEARDVNITTAGSCPGEINSCPATDDLMRCCYSYYDAESDPESGAEFKWYRYDSSAPGDNWVLTTEAGQTVQLQSSDDTNRWKCSARVSDGSQWSPDANSPTSIVGGPCFTFSSSVSGTPMQCGQTSSVSITVSAQAGERTVPADIMISMDRSGSMSWIGRYDGSGTERSAFFDGTNVFGGTSSYVYKLDVNTVDGGLSYTSGNNTAIDDAWGVFADSNYVYVADNDAGLTIIDKSSMTKIRTIGETSPFMTTARSVVVDGDFAYVAAAGTITEGMTQMFDASMTSSRDDDEQIGYSSSNSWAAQSFQSGTNVIDGVRLELRRYGSPADLTVHLRSSLTGSDLTNGTATVSSSSVPSGSWSDNWIDVDFPDSVSVTVGETYYIVLTTTTQSTSNYYRWGSRSMWWNPYWYGSLFRCNSSDNCQQLDYFFNYEDARFRVYYYGSIVGGLVIVDKNDSDPNNWVTVSNLYDTGPGGLIDEPEDVFYDGGYAYIADNAGGDGTEGLWVVDVSDEQNPTATGFVQTTNAQAVAVSGNYAFVADEDSGLRIIDISNKSSPSIVQTIGGLGTANDIMVYDTNVYVLASTGSGATSTGIHVIDASTPSSSSLITTFYMAYDGYKFFVGDKYGFVQTSYGTISFDRIFGTKMNFSKNSAQEFVLFSEWQSPRDKLGVASYGNGDSTLNHELVDANSSNKQSIATMIDTIMSEGGTPMHLGLEEALNELLGSNGREEAMQFIILLADGQSDSGTQSQIDTQVARAQSNEVYIYTIGFGADVDETQMQNISYNAYCPVPGIDCGSYHHISDPSALSQIYAIIAQEIANLTGRLPDYSATDIDMQFSKFQGLELSNFSPTPYNWDDTALLLQYRDINVASPWTATFDAVIPCDYAGCSTDFTAGSTADFPPEDTLIYFEIGGEAQDPIQWPEKFIDKEEFYYNDLTIGFVGGVFHGVSDTFLSYLVSNIGYIDDIDLGLINPAVEFFSGESSLEACEAPLDQVGSENLPGRILDAAYGDDAGPKPSRSESSNIAASGYLCLWINRVQDPIVECSENNTEIVHCAPPKTYLYTLDYWAWEK